MRAGGRARRTARPDWQGIGGWSGGPALTRAASAVLAADAGAGFDNIGANINQGRFGIQQPWTGEAADQAKNWLTAYHSSVIQLGHYFQGASQAIQALAQDADSDGVDHLRVGIAHVADRDDYDL